MNILIRAILKFSATKKCRSVDNTTSDLTGPRFESQTFRIIDEHLLLDQLVAVL